MTYDLLIKGGHVLDPARGLDGQLDIAVTGGKIARIEAGIPGEEAARVIEASGPGLVPVHTLRAGLSYSPHWGTHPWGWLPARA